jgi:putative phage-type endonuclease
MRVIKNIEQGTPEWHALRLGKFTASQAQAIATNGKGLETLVLEKAAELLTQKIPEEIDNDGIKRGKELEAEARAAYEVETGRAVEQAAFVERDEHCGCSPDGLISRDGLIEIKCKNDKNHLLMLLEEPIDSKHIWQMQMQMLVCGRQWCDFVSYNPNFEGRELVIRRVFSDPVRQDKIVAGLEAGIAQLKKLMERIYEQGKSTK